MKEKRFIFPGIFSWLEDLIYYAIAASLVVAALTSLVSAGFRFMQTIGGDLFESVVGLLDALLLVMMLVEILHTINISLRQHVLSSEPFLVVGLIAAVRRMLVITAEQSRLMERLEVFRLILVEMLLLGVLILVLAAAIYILHRSRSTDEGTH